MGAAGSSSASNCQIHLAMMLEPDQINPITCVVFVLVLGSPRVLVGEGRCSIVTAQPQ